MDCSFFQTFSNAFSMLPCHFSTLRRLVELSTASQKVSLCSDRTSYSTCAEFLTRTFDASDMNTIDEQLMMTLRSFLATIFSVISTIVVVSGVTPIFTLCLIPMIIYYVIQQRFFTVRLPETVLDSANILRCLHLPSFHSAVDVP